MGLFKKKPDELSQVALLADAYRLGDQARIQRARDELSPIQNMDVLFGLYEFGQHIGTRLKAEDKQTAQAIFSESATGSAKQRAAVAAIGNALFVECTQPALSNAANEFLMPLNDEPNAIRLALIETIRVIGVLCERLDIGLNFKSV